MGSGKPRDEDFAKQQAYFLLDIGRLAEELLASQECILSKFFALERVRTPEEMLRKVKEAAAYLKGRHFQEINALFCQWIMDVGVQRVGLDGQNIPEVTELEEVGSMLETTIRHWEENIRRDALKQGEDRGRQEGDKNARKSIVRNLASIHMDERQIALVTGLSGEEVREVLQARPAGQM